jgi:tight adherence protein B
MSQDTQLAAAVAGFALLIFFGGLVGWLKRRRDVRRLRRHVAAHARGVAPSSPQALKRPVDGSALIVSLNRRLSQTSLAKQQELQLVRSGLGITPNQLILGQIGAGALLFIVGRYALFGEEGSLPLLCALAMSTPAIVLPRFVLKYLQHRRVRRFEGQLAQSVDVMAGALQAGSSLPQSFELVSREMPKPIGEEFSRLMQEAGLGVPLEQTLDNMLERVPSMDLEMLVTAISIQYRVGGNLSHILKTIAHTIRERVRIRGEISTLTAQARLSSYIISLMPVGVVAILMLLSHDYIIKLFDPGITRFLLIGGIAGIISGFYCMQRIAAIEV